MSWGPGDAVVRREVLGDGRAWLGTTVHVIEDTPEHLVSYLMEGAPLGFPEGDWPNEGGRHPWSNRSTWYGHGTLMVQRPGESHAIWHFWEGPEREFVCWYVNLQEPFRRTSIGYDTQDLELDLVVRPDGSWQVKDRELMPKRVAEGRFTQAEVDDICRYGDALARRLEAGERFWDERWSRWQPPADLRPRPLLPGWERLATPDR